MRHSNLIGRIFSVFLAFLFGSCGQGSPANTGAKASLSGAWRINKVVRNLDDITANGDFGQCVLTLDADSTYTVDKTTLFVVNKEGSWSVRRQSGGELIVLKPREGDPTATYELRYDTSGGGEHIRVNFTTGGYNTYQYLLERVTPQEKGKL